MTTWQISESGTTVQMQDGAGAVTFTVTNPTAVEDRVVLTVTPLDGAAADWFTVERPQRTVDGGGSVVIAVTVTVPPGTAEGTYAFQGLAYSADSDPSESSATSKRIEIPVGASVPPPRSPRWPYLVAAVAVVLVVGVLVFLLTRGGGEEATTDTTEPPETTAVPTTATTAPPPTFGTIPIPVTIVPLPIKPDLQVSVASVNCQSGVFSSDLEIVANVANFGPGTVGGFVGLVLEGPDVSDSATAPAGLGQVTFDVSTSFVTLFSPQTYTITVDPFNTVDESDESNNQVIATVGVGVPSGPNQFSCQ